MSLNDIPRFDTHSHSEYSNIRLIDSINKIPDMIKTAHRLGMKGIALTDHECVSGHLKWLQTEKKLKEKGEIPEDFKCACGNEIYLVDDRTNIERYWHYILIAKNAEGHRAIRELSSTAWYHSFTSRGMTRVPTEKKELEAIVKKYPDSLIATTACIGGQLGGRVLQLINAESHNDEEEILRCKLDIDAFIRWNLNLFGNDFYIEVAAGQSKDQIKFNKRIASIANAYRVRMVIGSDAHYLTAAERPLHKAYLNSKEGDREVDEFYFDAHMMDNEEAFGNLQVAFSEEDFGQMCVNSMEIYDKIEHFELERKPIIPEVKVKHYNPVLMINLENCGFPTLFNLFRSDNIQERYWVNQCWNSLEEKHLLKFDGTLEERDKAFKYIRRLEVEADIIKTIGEKLDDCLFKYFNTF
jgi:DNA polymerase-3 subunit alpha